MAEPNKLFQLLLIKFNALQKSHDALSEQVKQHNEMFKVTTEYRVLHKKDLNSEKAINDAHEKARLTQQKYWEDDKIAIDLRIDTLNDTVISLITHIQKIPTTPAPTIPPVPTVTISTNTDYNLPDTSRPPPNFILPPPYYIPQFTKFYSKAHYRPRICYNCKKPGHIAKHCSYPNPRILHLHAHSANQPKYFTPNQFYT